MFIKRFVVLFLTIIMLAACGAGDEQAAAPTEPPAPTERPTATPRPTATAAAEVEPTEDVPVVAVGEIPPPPQGQLYEEGQDPLVDAAVSGMQSEFDNQQIEGFALRDITFYTSEASLDEATDFYQDSMSNYGWGIGQEQNEDFGRILIFLGPDFETAAMIGLLDMSTVDASLDGLIVFTAIGESDESLTGAIDTPTEIPAGTTNIIPPPPNSETYVEGSDPVIDAAVSAMEESFAGQEGSGLDMSPIEFFVSDEDANAVADFYAEELTFYGWDTSAGQVQDQDFGKVIVYPAEDDPNTVALIGILDLATVDQSLSGLIVFTTIGTASGSGSTPGGTSGVGSIPVPADATLIEKGEDAILDTLIDSLAEGLQPTLDEENMLVNNQGLYRSPSGFEDLVNFYRDEMAALGWTEDTFQEQEGSTVMVYTKDTTNGAMIMVMDGELLLQEQNIILILDMSQN